MSDFSEQKWIRSFTRFLEVPSFMKAVLLRSYLNPDLNLLRKVEFEV